MPIGAGIAVHTDSMHSGSAARDVADGVAGLGPAGNLLAVGPDLELTRDGSDNIEVVERTSGEIVARWTRVGVDDYEFRVHCGAVACLLLNDSMVDVANGIAGLDASVEIPTALLKVDVANGIAGLDASVEIPLALLKTDVVNGLPLLDALGDLLVLGNRLELTRDGSDIIVIGDRTSGEVVARWTRNGANDNDMYLHNAGSAVLVQHSGMRDVAGGLPVLDSDVKVLAGQMPVPMLTVAQFQANAATGTAGNPGNANNTILIDSAYFDAIGEYVEVQFDYRNFITKYRLYGGTYHNEDGAYKIQHYEDAAWVDNTLNIPTNLAVWSAWVFLDIPVYTKAIRLVATAIDTLINTNTLAELEIEG